MPSLRQFQYLVAVADLRHFGRAASSLNVSQPTLSQQLRALELRLGVTLVERGSGQLQLTPVGRDVVKKARQVLLEVEDIKSLARKSAQGIAGTIRFGVSPTLGPYLMPSVVAGLHRQYPELRLYMREGIPDEQLAELRRGELDLLLTMLPVGGSDLHLEPLFREPLHLVAAPDNPLFALPAITPSDLRGQPVLSLDTRHHLHRQTRDVCAELGADLLSDYEGTSLDSLRQMSGSGLGLALLPELYLRSEAGGEDMVRRLPIVDWQANRSIVAVWREGVAFAATYLGIAEVIAKEADRAMKRPLISG